MSSLCRRFQGQPVSRLIVSVPVDMVSAVDQLLRTNFRHPARRCRAEFVRLAIAEKLERDLMLLSGPKEGASRAQIDGLGTLRTAQIEELEPLDTTACAVGFG